jgi:hypothetical protein
MDAPVRDGGLSIIYRFTRNKIARAEVVTQAAPSPPEDPERTASQATLGARINGEPCAS